MRRFAPLPLLLAAAFAGCDPVPGARAYADPPRPSPPHAVSRLERAAAAEAPSERGVTREVLDRGRERYAIFCTPCHGLAGDGDGRAVQGGVPPPPSFHQEPQRGLDPETIVAAITNGAGLMLPMAERIPPSDRWAIAGYVKALQLSRDPQAAADGADGRATR